MIKFLYTNIGRGHPFYLDGIIEVLKGRDKLKIESYDVFEVSSGLALTTWKIARRLYKAGSTDSFIGNLYNRFRDNSQYRKNDIAMRIMGRDIRRKFLTDDTPLVVDHPVLLGILQGKKNLLYQHGEIAVPAQAVVPGADYVFVPVESCAVPFWNAGYRKDQIIVSGLCIEPRLAKYAESNLEGRLERISSDRPLTGAFFSSGAEPKPHVDKLVLAIVSVFESGGCSFVYPQIDGSFLKKEQEATERAIFEIILHPYRTREDLDANTFKDFHRYDYLVAPSHERTNWALGLGLPMFVLEPPIGPFAPLNKLALLQAGVAECLNSVDEAKGFAIRLADLRKSGKLAKMAESGWEKHSVTGFQAISDFLIKKYGASS